MVAKNWSSLLIEVTISRRLFVVMPENGIFCEFDFPNGILWEFSQIFMFWILRDVMSLRDGQTSGKFIYELKDRR